MLRIDPFDDAARLDREQAYRQERRRQAKTPRAIERRNRDKRTGKLEFQVAEDGTRIIMWTGSRTSKAGRTIIATLAQVLGAKAHLYQSTKGNACLRFELANPAQLLATIGCVPVPQKCERCDGTGAIDKQGKSTWSTWADRSSLCPACHGSGRALDAASSST
jgi:hypothetical protein